MAFRNKKMTMPSLDDIVMQIMAMNEALYHGEWSIGTDTWNNYRPATWPTADYLLKFYAYTVNNAGWDKLLADHIGVERKTQTQMRIEQSEARMAKRWQLDSHPDYSAVYSEDREAMHDRGLLICQATYERTGRMVLR